MSDARHPSLLPVNPYVAPEVTGTEAVPYVAGYLGQISVAAGEPLEVHAATRSDAPCFVHVYRVVGCADPTLAPALEHVADLGEIEPVRYPRVTTAARIGPGDADSDGCGWPPIRVLDAVPASWGSGLYLVQLSASREPTGRLSPRLGSDALLIVRPAAGAVTASALLQVNVGTWAAYCLWRNRSLYVGRDREGNGHGALRAHRASLLRPGLGLGLPNETLLTPAPPKAFYAFAFIDWLERAGIACDVCSGLDVADGTIDLDPYAVVITVGHDEYWTRDQRRRLVAFREGGGHLAFFGGNLAYWQIRHDAAERVVACHKRDSRGPHDDIEAGVEPLDPRYPQDVDELTVQTWSSGSTPATLDLTGVYNVQRRTSDPAQLVIGGGMWWWEETGGPARPTTPFIVTRPEHWAFAGTGLAEGEAFGGAARIVGHEADGLDVGWPEEGPRLTFDDGADPATELLAVADCRAWSEAEHADGADTTVPGRTVSDAAVGGVVTMIAREADGQGILFTAPTTEWVFGLVESIDWTSHDGPTSPVLPVDPVVERVTRNVLEALGVTHGALAERGSSEPG